MKYKILFFLIFFCTSSYIFSFLDYDRGAAAAVAEKWEEASDHYAKALSVDPSNPELLYDYGVASFKTNKVDQAEVCFELAAENKEADADLREASYFNLGNVKASKEQFSQAVTAYEKALRINPENERAQHNRDLAKQKEEEKKEQEEQQSQDDPSGNQEDSDDQENSDNSQENNQDQDQLDEDSQGSSEQQDNGDESSDQGDQSQNDNQQGTNNNSDSKEDGSQDKQQEDDFNDQLDQDKKDAADHKQDTEQQEDKNKQEEQQSQGEDQEQNLGAADGEGAEEEDDEDERFDQNLEGVSPWIADMLDQQEAHESDLSKQKMKSAIDGQAGSKGKNAW